MKVLHLNSYDKKGGAETVFQITNKIENVENFCGYVKIDESNVQPDVLFRSWENESKLIGIVNYIFSIYNYRKLKNFLYKTPVDVIHIHGFFSSISPSILLAIKKIKQTKKIKIVQTLHDFHLICPNAGLYNFRKNELCEKCIGKKVKLSILKENCDRREWIHSIIKGIRSFIANNVLKHREIIDKFICPSEFMKTKLLEDGISENKIVIIRNPVVIKNYETSFQKKNIVCYFGRFSREKNLEFLVEAFTLWKNRNKNDFQLLLIGEGEEEEKLKQIVSNSSVKDEISFNKFTPYEKLVDIIKEAKYLSLSSSCYENAPMAIIEALSLNIIALAPNIGGMRESIESVIGVGKTYLPNDKDSWNDALSYLEDHYQEQFDKLISSKRLILDELSVHNYYRILQNIYIE